MGKKTRKTRWRTLSISGTQSDSESIVNGDEGHTNEKHGRLQQRFYQSNNNSHPKYNSTNHYSSHSTPTRLYNGYHNKYQTSKSTTRSSSTASENKITFNEEEYTRITTPRQDVLFKKGYLSKPKPYLQQHHHQQQQLTSTGNSTGDGTPDHQSADGTEGDLGEFEQPPFVFPGSYLDHHSTIYYVNGYEPYAASASHHPMVMYNPTLCYPYVAGGGAPRVKRYSTDSMTDSTSPSNECQDDATEFGPMPPCFIYNTGFPPVYDVPHTDSANVAQETTEETNKQNTPVKNKRKRRKSKNDDENDENEEDCSSDEESKSHEASATVVQLDESSSDSKVTPDSNEPQTIETTAPSETDATTTAIKYRVDAEEFVPRAYRPPVNALPPGFVPMPLCPDMMFIPPGMMMAPPPGPHFIPGRFYDMNPFYQTTKVQENIDATTTNKEIQDEDEIKDMEEVEVATNPEAAIESHLVTPSDAEKNNDDVSEGGKTKQAVPSEKQTGAPPHAIDIAKIVSKLEEAALEQKRLEKEAQQKTKEGDDEIRSEKSQKYLEMHPRPVRRAQQSQHRERRTHLNSINKKPDKSVSTELETVEPKINHKTEPSTRNTTAISTTEPLLNKKLLTTVDAAPAPVQIQEVLPAAVHTPQPTFTEKLKSSSRKITPPKPVAVCPRLQRQRSRPEVESRPIKPRTPVQVIAAPVQSRTTPPDAWISVSSKKKRKTKNQEDVEDTIDYTNIVEEIEPIVEKIIVDTPIVVAEEQLVHMAEVSKAKKEPECDVAIINESPKKKQNSNKVKKPRRRIIINDEALLMNGKEESPTPQLEVKTEKKPKEIKQVPPIIVENCTPAVIVKTPEVIPVQIETPVVVTKQKKKKKRTNTKAHKEPSDCDDSSTASTIDATEACADDDASKTNVEVSLEIDRMIQRGLYANLEEKIRLFNPSDSFIHASTEKDVEPSLSSVMDGFSFDMVKSLESTNNNNNNKLQNFKNFDFSGMLFNGTTMNRTLQRAMTTKMALKTATTSNVCQDVPKTPDDDKTTELTVTELVTSPHDSIESLTMDEPTTTATITASIDSVARLQITRAVKEWMDRTRENTPEVEIFKNPQELRQEFLLSDIEDDSDETISASREGSADLLECWEPEMVAEEKDEKPVVQCECEMRTPSPEPVIEQGEDALEVYESVYGKNADYLRIKAEVKDGGAQATATKAPFGVRDGGLPYRAICCTVM